MKVAIVFAHFGPYHHARVRALQARAEFPVLPLEIAPQTKTYAWSAKGPFCSGLTSLCDGAKEEVSPWRVFFLARRFFLDHGVTHVLLPSYAPAPETALLLAAKACKLRCIMMNESHALTERATGWRRWLKKQLIKCFDAALVGGSPHKRHFACLGIPEKKIFTGYDAVDNRTFQTGANEARKNAKLLRQQLALPPRYFLNLGRMIGKKNLETLVSAYAAYCKASEEPVALSLVGSGENEQSLKEQAIHLGLRVHDFSSGVPEDTTSLGRGDVGFYGFRQIGDNPAFYGLAEVFILPSTFEEWGLVVNEAMSCGLPVLVAEGVGCAENLVANGINGYTFEANDAEVLGQRLVKLAGDRTLRLKMGKASENMITDWGVDNFARKAIAAVEAGTEPIC